MEEKISSFLSSFRITDRESCKKVIRNGGIAALISAGFTAIFAVAGFFLKPSNQQLSYFLDPWLLVDVWLLLLLAVFVFRKSRLASTVLVLYLVASKVFLWIDLGAPKGVIVSIIFFAYYATAMRGTYIWHDKYGGDETESPSPIVSDGLAMTGLRVILTVGFVGLFMKGIDIALRPGSVDRILFERLDLQGVFWFLLISAMVLFFVAVVYLWRPFGVGYRLAQLGLAVDFLETSIGTILGVVHPEVLKQAVISSRHERGLAVRPELLDLLDDSTGRWFPLLFAVVFVTIALWLLHAFKNTLRKGPL